MPTQLRQSIFRRSPQVWHRVPPSARRPGICIHVFGEVNGREEEVLRFDCFQRAPHYHYAWSTNDQYVALDTTADGDPFNGHWNAYAPDCPQC
jgi:hypothetical protein